MWLVVSVGALVFLIGADLVRFRHVELVSSVADEPAGGTAGNGARLPGDPATWRPRLIVPEHNNASFEWLALTRQMLAKNEWRVRRIDYENAPFGHDVLTPSPYRWWLGLVAWGEHSLSGRPWGASLERAALLADPLLHVLLFLGLVMFARWRFGGPAAAAVAVGIAGFFPFGAAFLPGMPEEIGLSLIFAIASVLPLVSGIYPAKKEVSGGSRRISGWFFAAGVAGGLGLWVSVPRELPVLVGLPIGALIAAGVARRGKPGGATGPSAWPWRIWGLGGAVTVLAAYLIEYAPDHLGGWEVRVVHPLFAVAWIGAAELTRLGATWIEGGRAVRRWSEGLLWLFGLLCIAGVPVTVRLTHNASFLESNLPSLRVARLEGSPSAENLFSWIGHEGMSTAVWVTILPLLVVVPAIWGVTRGGAARGEQLAAALGLGPVAALLGFACRHLTDWHGLDAMLIALLAVTAAAWTAEGGGRGKIWALAGLLGVAVLPSVIRLTPRVKHDTSSLSPPELYGLIERDLSRSLENQQGNSDGILLAPHNQSIALHYYGGWRGLPTFGPENRDGLSIAVRILSALTPEEAKELTERRQIAMIVIPSWDSYLDVYAEMGLGTLEGTFLATLHDWRLPTWLRAVPYQLPTIQGFEGQSVTLLQVVEDQEESTALSRTAEYFLEMGQLDRAAAMAQALRRFPADLGAIVARAQVEYGRGELDAFGRTVELLRPRLASGADRRLPWDRRLALAVVLYQAKLKDLARERLQHCVEEADEAKVRSLSTGAIYRLLVLARAYELSFREPKVGELALNLLPPEARSRLGGTE